MCFIVILVTVISKLPVSVRLHHRWIGEWWLVEDRVVVSLKQKLNPVIFNCYFEIRSRLKPFRLITGS